MLYAPQTTDLITDYAHIAASRILNITNDKARFFFETTKFCLDFLGIEANPIQQANLADYLGSQYKPTYYDLFYWDVKQHYLNAAQVLQVEAPYIFDTNTGKALIAYHVCEAVLFIDVCAEHSKLDVILGRDIDL